MGYHAGLGECVALAHVHYLGGAAPQYAYAYGHEHEAYKG